MPEEWSLGDEKPYRRKQVAEWLYAKRAASFAEMSNLPAALRGQYQSFTEAPMDRLRAAGYAGQFTPLEEGVRRYVQDHLATADRYV